jgi:tRNA-2-methylthio-N6-dimethylallyladenosine synthase
VKSFYIETHGCQMNVHDSEKISGLLRHSGLRPVSSLAAADLFVLNTCSVREKAAQKVFSRLGELKDRKAKDPNFTLAVVGCVAQQEGEQMVNKAPHVDLVVGTHLYHAIPDYLDEIVSQHRPSVGTSPVHNEFLTDSSPIEIDQVVRATQFRAHVTVMEGCNKRCAFCVVPNTRGKERNRPAARILNEVRRAAGQGYVEVVLLGQTVNSYKDPGNPHYRFVNLLADTAAIPGVRRVRFASPHPRHFSDDLIELIASNETICNQVHLPVQSGSTPILRRMRRQHDADWYRELVEKFRCGSRQVGLSTDVIVGFPGETEMDFRETLSLLEEVRYEQMFSFKYSIRSNTEASGWIDDVPEEVKSERLTELQRLQSQIQIELHRTHYLGQEFQILVEGKARDGYRRCGRTTTNKVVNFLGEAKAGDFVRVRVTAAGANSLTGEIVEGVPLRRNNGARVQN